MVSEKQWRLEGVGLDTGVRLAVVVRIFSIMVHSHTRVLCSNQEKWRGKPISFGLENFYEIILVWLD